MKKKSIIRSSETILTVLFLCFCLVPSQLNACSEIFFNYKQQFIVARTMDFPYGNSALTVYPRNMERQSLVFKEEQNPLKWISKYGSISFDSKIKAKGGYAPTYNGCVFGMNEKGLTAGVLYLIGNKYPKPDSKPVLDSATWAQYVLDNFSDVDSVIADLEADKYRIILAYCKDIGELPMHLTIHDSSNNSAIIEYISGKLIVHKNPTIKVLTNTPYSEDAEAIKEYKSFGGDKEIPGDTASTSRFIKGAYNIKNLIKCLENNPDDKTIIPTIPEQLTAYAFDMIQTIIQPLGCDLNSEFATQWTIVTDITNKKMYFRTFNNANISYIKLKEVDFSKKHPVQYNFYDDLSRQSNIINKF